VLRTKLVADWSVFQLLTGCCDFGFPCRISSYLFSAGAGAACFGVRVKVVSIVVRLYSFMVMLVLSRLFHRPTLNSGVSGTRPI
jgi:hypothetical protein